MIYKKAGEYALFVHPNQSHTPAKAAIEALGYQCGLTQPSFVRKYDVVRSRFDATGPPLEILLSHVPGLT